jgi:hypothetical protein
MLGSHKRRIYIGYRREYFLSLPPLLLVKNPQVDAGLIYQRYMISEKVDGINLSHMRWQLLDATLSKLDRIWFDYLNASIEMLE